MFSLENDKSFSHKEDMDIQFSSLYVNIINAVFPLLQVYFICQTDVHCLAMDNYLLFVFQICDDSDQICTARVNICYAMGFDL